MLKVEKQYQNVKVLVKNEQIQICNVNYKTVQNIKIIFLNVNNVDVILIFQGQTYTIKEHNSVVIELENIDKYSHRDYSYDLYYFCNVFVTAVSCFKQRMEMKDFIPLANTYSFINTRVYNQEITVHNYDKFIKPILDFTFTAELFDTTITINNKNIVVKEYKNMLLKMLKLLANLVIITNQIFLCNIQLWVIKLI